MSGPAPKNSYARTKASLTLDESATSHAACAALPSPCSARISAATRSTSEVVRAATKTRAPSRANASATARPMPRPPPVTKAVLFDSLIVLEGRG
jgi:hypothetical protein